MRAYKEGLSIVAPWDIISTFDKIHIIVISSPNPPVHNVIMHAQKYYQTKHKILTHQVLLPNEQVSPPPLTPQLLLAMFATKLVLDSWDSRINMIPEGALKKWKK